MNIVDYFKDKSEGIYGAQLADVARINRLYEIYAGKQKWEVNAGLDYEPTQIVVNYVKKLINTKSRFMFGMEPFFDLRQIVEDNLEGDAPTLNQDITQEKEDLLKYILIQNKFHSKLIKGCKDCLIGGKVAIKLWASKEIGVKLIFSPAQEFFVTYNIDDIDVMEEVKFVYFLNDAIEAKDQRVNKQTWKMVGKTCILNEGIYDGNAKLIEEIIVNKDTELPFIPVIVINNGGLTGETTGDSDVETLWDSQDAYNKLTSDDIDALKFQMFGQDVITDASEDSIASIKIAPGALIDMQTDPMQAQLGKQANIKRLESGFSYAAKFIDTINRVKNDMFDLLDIPNVSL